MTDLPPLPEPVVAEELGPIVGPAYLSNGHTAYPSGIVASWPEHNAARFNLMLFTGEQLAAAVAAERERCAKEAEHWQTISTTPGHACGQYIAAAIRKGRA